MRLTSFLLFPVRLGICASPLSRHISYGDIYKCLEFINIIPPQDITPELHCKALDRIGHGRRMVPFVIVVRVKAIEELSKTVVYYSKLQLFLFLYFYTFLVIFICYYYR